MIGTTPIDLISVVLIDQRYPHSRGNDDFT